MSVSFVIEMLVLGVGVGILSGALGLGGGILMVPAFMMFVPGMDAHTAKGTSLFIIIFVSAVNAWRMMRPLERKPWALTSQLAAGSVAGGYLGAWLTTLVDERVVVALFMALMLVLGYRTFFLRELVVDEAAVRRRLPVSVGIGLLAGLVGGATGTGGGAVLIPLALMAGIVGNSRVVGLSNMVMILTSVAGSVAHLSAAPVFEGGWTIGHVNLALAPLVFAGAQAGSYWGRRLNTHLTLPRRRVAMGALLLFITARMAYELAARG